MRRSVIPTDQRRALRAVEAGIDADGTYPSLDGEGRAQLTEKDIGRLYYLKYGGFITEQLTLTDYGREALDQLRALWAAKTAPAEPVEDEPPEVKDRTTCVSAKVRFTTEQAGAEWLARHRKQKRPGEPRLRLYDCPWCGGWHVTSKQSWTDRKVKGSWS